MCCTTESTFASSVWKSSSSGTQAAAWSPSFDEHAPPPPNFALHRTTPRSLPACTSVVVSSSCRLERSAQPVGVAGERMIRYALAAKFRVQPQTLPHWRTRSLRARSAATRSGCASGRIPNRRVPPSSFACALASRGRCECERSAQPARDGEASSSAVAHNSQLHRTRTAALLFSERPASSRAVRVR